MTDNMSHFEKMTAPLWKCHRCERPLKPKESETCNHCLRILASHELMANSFTTRPPTTTRQSSGRGGYKHPSEAMGVDPWQVEEHRAFLKASGCGDVEHTPDGRPIATSDRQFQAIAKAKKLKTGRDGYDQMQTGRDGQIALEKHKAEIQAQLDKLPMAPPA